MAAARKVGAENPMLSLKYVLKLILVGICVVSSEKVLKKIQTKKDACKRCMTLKIDVTEKSSFLKPFILSCLHISIQ